jgi:hypothetical protein
MASDLKPLGFQEATQSFKEVVFIIDENDR